ncbi:hypothetical protein BH20ACT2_BH20ACT2_08600 [soil metagenome]
MWIASPVAADIAGINPDNDDVVESDGQITRVIGSFACTADETGNRFRVALTLTQGGTRARGQATGTCNGNNFQQYTAFLTTDNGGPLVAGSANLTARGQINETRDPATPNDRLSASETVQVVIP